MRRWRAGPYTSGGGLFSALLLVGGAPLARQSPRRRSCAGVHVAESRPQWGQPARCYGNPMLLHPCPGREAVRFPGNPWQPAAPRCALCARHLRHELRCRALPAHRPACTHAAGPQAAFAPSKGLPPLIMNPALRKATADPSLSRSRFLNITPNAISAVHACRLCSMELCSASIRPSTNMQ